MRSLNLKFKKGFTIIELMIAMTIMSFIAVFVYQNTSKSFELRETLTQDGEFYNSVRVALDTFGRDVIHIYNPQAASLPGNLGKAASTDPQNPQANINLPTTIYKFWGAPINSNGVRPTRFNGEDNSISFISNSHMRLFRDSPETEFAKITYGLEEDKLSKNPNKQLVKRENTDVFALERENEETETRYILLSNIRSLKFKYLNGEKDTWFNSWDTTSEDHKGKFPDLIQIEIEIELPRTGNTFTVMQNYKPEGPI